MDKLRVRQKEFLQCVCTGNTEEIVALDYSPDAGNVPTLRQMIMNIISPSQQVPLFHCVERDWRLEGFKLQYAPLLREEAETAINTLLPLLQHMFPTVDVADNFEAEAEIQCQYMQWDESKQMIIDAAAPDETPHITEDENLVGFIFDINTKRPGLSRPAETSSSPIPKFPPHDDDSISTLHPSDRTTLTNSQSRTTTQSNSVSSARTQPASTSNSSVTSHSTISVQSFLNLESKVAGLASQILVHQNRHANQFDSIMASLATIQTNPTSDHQPTTQSNSARSSQSSIASGQGS